MKMTRFFTLISIVLLLAACSGNRREWRALGRAEAICQSEPDAAYAILDSIDYAGNNREFKARLQLARADCIYYSDELTADNDSAITEAIDYFASRNDRRRLTRAYFLRANQRECAGEFSDAIIDLLKAEKCAEATKDSISLGLVYRAMSSLYNELEDMNSSALYAERSYNIFRDIRSERYLNWAIFEYARSLSNALRYDEAEAILLKGLEKCRAEGEEVIYNESLRLLGSVYNYKNEHNKAVEYFTKYTLCEYPEINKLYWMNYGRSLVEVGRIEEAEAMQDSLTKYFPEEHYLKLRLAYYYGDKDEIIRLLDVGLQEQNKDFTTLYGREFAGIIDNYYKEQQAAVEAREERDRMVIAAVCLLALLLILMLSAVMWHFRNVRRENAATVQQLEEEVKAKEIQRIEVEEKANRRLDDLRDQMKDLLAARINDAERLFRDYGEAPRSKKEQAIYRRIRKSLEDFAPGTDYLKSVEATADGMLDGLMSDFRHDYPSLKERDYALFLYHVLQLSTQTVCAVLGITPGYFYAMRSRLRKHIGSRPDLAARFLPFIGE